MTSDWIFGYLDTWIDGETRSLTVAAQLQAKICGNLRNLRTTELSPSFPIDGGTVERKNHKSPVFIEYPKNEKCHFHPISTFFRPETRVSKLKRVNLPSNSTEFPLAAPKSDEGGSSSKINLRKSALRGGRSACG